MLTTFGESKGALTIKIPSKKPLSNAEITKKDKFSPSPIHRDVTALRCHLCRQKLPGLRELRVTDREIEAMLARSARAMRRGTKEVVTASGMRFQVDPNSEFGKAFPLRTESKYKDVLTVLRGIQGTVLINEDTGTQAKLSSNGVNKILSNKARRKSIANGYSDSQHLQAAANIDMLYRNGVLLETRGDRNNDPNIASIKRFAAPFYTEGDFAEALITLKESVEDGHRIYSLELDEIKKPSSADKEGLENQADTSPLDGHSPSGTLSEAIADQNSADGNSPSSILNKGFEAPRPHDGYYNLQRKIEKARAENKKINNDTRFSLAEYSEADRNSLVEIIRPFVGREMDKSDAEYLKFFQDRGYPVHTDAWAHAFAAEAMYENNDHAKKIDAVNREKWLYENMPFYREAVDMAGGTDFTIVPSFKFAGESFSGTFIAGEWRKYSDKKYKSEGLRRQKLEEDRKSRLENAKGIMSDKLAQRIAARTGEDAVIAEERIIAFYKDLKRPDLDKYYTDHKRERILQSKAQEKLVREEWKAQEEQRIREERIRKISGKLVERICLPSHNSPLC